jgi:hypothetical protein
MRKREGRKQSPYLAGSAFVELHGGKELAPDTVVDEFLVLQAANNHGGMRAVALGGGHEGICSWAAENTHLTAKASASASFVSSLPA